MIILAIDTAFDACSAAIISGSNVLWAEQRIIGKGHSEILPPMVATGFAAAKITPKDIGRIGVVVGPGAFAGVRVGVAFARGFRIGLEAGLVGITSNEALAASLPPGEGLIATVFNARRGQVYAALHDAAVNALLPPFVASPDEAAARLSAVAGGAQIRLAGSGAALMITNSQYTEEKALHADPVAIARRAAIRPVAPELPTPLYLRPPDAAPSSGSIFAGLAPL
ncbi:MAG: tRNA (adenosine(37)-N6)-threonylcarbamoyltransferase complex dimerization subunit type 1 TsaB [Parvularculaceae bacterium]|nr:tRNA (adenosine(37)-N6)-threonylcarbamoyltransferase complex dimerization subunit type 1 TsaB [Parvularculaceae bacterium]